MSINRNKNLINKIKYVFLFITTLLIIVAISLKGFGIKLHASGNTFNINSVNEMNAYADAYYNGTMYNGVYTSPDDTLNIAINTGTEIVNDGYISIGTQSKPFAGKIIVPNTGKNVFNLYNCPLFNYVTTDFTIEFSDHSAGVVNITRQVIAENPTANTLTSGSLFANHVVAGSSAANWSINLAPYSGDRTEASNFESVIGDIASNATVTITFTNNANLNVVSSANAGLICGTLGSDATLNVTTAGSGSNLSVTSSAGSAGGLVGRMEEGSTLQFDSVNNSRVTTVSGSSNAGGIVGYFEDANLAFGGGVTNYTVSGSITSGSGNGGGLIGNYVNSESPITFSLEKYTISNGTTISGYNSCGSGGVFGRLENTGASFTFNGDKANKTINATLSGNGYRGGVIGLYVTDNLSNTLVLTNTKTKLSVNREANAGGLIGLISGPAYVDISNVEIGSTNTIGGGLVGTGGDNGPFIDVTGNVTIGYSGAQGPFGAGLVHSLSSGVLRIQGTTDLSLAKTTGVSAGQIVKDRDNSLVYALGNGTTSGWILKRNTSTTNCNDIATWGEVLRCDGTNLNESDLFTVSGHTVTIKAATTTLSSITDFALTSLNIKHNVNSGAGNGALQFTSGSANYSSTLLTHDLTLGANIDLSGTGLIGLTRDNGTNASFTATFDGNNKTITFNTGEVYGVNASGVVLDRASCHSGNILPISTANHAYLGLFAKTSGATVKDLTLSGLFDLVNASNDSRVGGFSAQSSGNLTATNVTVDFDVDMYMNGAYSAYYGGLVGEGTGNLNFSITNSDIQPTISDTSSAKGDTNGNRGPLCVGGVIGKVSHSTTQSITVASSTVGINYNRTLDQDNYITYFGGVIGEIYESSNVYQKNKRVITLGTNLTVNVTANSKQINDRFGGILGGEWLCCDVIINGVTINATITAKANSAAGNYGGLFQTATGHMDIQNITVTTANFTLPNADSFGFVANRTVTDINALYLEVDNTGLNYNISNLAFVNPSFTYYDEIVCDSRASGNAINDNGNSVISIKTSGNIISTSSSSYNTYLNKTAYGKSTGFINPQTRYYYNVANALNNLATSKYNFYVWSLKTYAHSSIKTWFNSATNSFSGDLDMTGISYYPVDITGGASVSFNNATIKLDNNLMEDYVKYSYYDDASHKDETRSTRSNDNQHYLMHTSLFRNVIGDVSITGSSSVAGNVPKISDSSVGFIISGTLGNHNTTDSSLTISGLALNGVFVSNNGSNFTNTTYAPLLVNNIGIKTDVDVRNVSQSTTLYSSYSGNGYYAGSSLFGDVGDDTASAISIAFNNITLDSRSSATNLGNMTTTYGTGKSIFSRATLLNSFLYDTDSSGSYNFEVSEDWPTATATHNVTYGWEITSSAEFAGLQKKYFTSDLYVHPTTYPTNSSEYNFSTGFLPYVYVGYDLANKKHELAINQSAATTISGCGQYNDPFVVTGDQLAIISKIIYGTDMGNTTKLYLPNELTAWATAGTTTWTSTSYTKYLYSCGNPGNPNFTSTDVGATDIAKDTVRKYLAGAYYVIQGSQTLPSTYIALGTASDMQLAFHGVIIGKSSATIINNSDQPLIYTSTGCVIKDLTVVVDVKKNSSTNITLASPLASDVYQLSNSSPAYGALIRQVLGGDTFIDNVDVSFSNATFNLTGDGVSSHYERLIPIGGYIGVLVNGGVIFRNMESSYVGLTNSDYNKINDWGYLYVNPIIGRVIAGYSFHETNSYRVESSNVDNGDKNYVISDLVKPANDATKLGVTYSSSTFNISVPDGQAMYILGTIVNSGAASAAYNASTEQAYDALSEYWQGYNAYTACREGSGYSTVSTSSGSDFTDAQNDSYNSDLVNIPYIIRNYTTKNNNNVYLARSMSYYTDSKNYSKCKISIGDDCDVAAGFRGIGSIYIDNERTRLLVQRMDGNGHTITLNMSYYEYDHNLIASSHYIAYKDGSSIGTNAGFGLFNRLYTTGTSETNSINNFALSGSIVYDLYEINDGSHSNYSYGVKTNRNEYSKFTGVRKMTHLSVGGIAGIVYGNVFYIKDVTFDDFTVDGAKYAGGYIGFIFNTKSLGDCNIKFSSTTVECGGYLDVTAGLAAGGMIGRCYYNDKGFNLNIFSERDLKTSIYIKNVSMKSTNPKESNQYSNNAEVGAGGILGAWFFREDGSSVSYTDEYGVTSDLSVKLKVITISKIKIDKGNYTGNIGVDNYESIVVNDLSTKNYESNYAGGIVGVISFAYLHINDCEVKDIDVSATIAGGIIGRVSQKCFIDVARCVVDGSNSASITGRYYAGGVFGVYEGHDEFGYSVSDVEVKNYTIEATSTANSESAAGGVVGIIGGVYGNNLAFNDARSHLGSTTNLQISNCSIITNYSGNSSTSGTGCIIGTIAGRQFRICGYNVYLLDNDVKHYQGGVVNDTYSVYSSNNRKIGEIVGNNSIDSPIKYVGVAVQNNSEIGRLCGKHGGADNTEYFGGVNGYDFWAKGEVVLANYLATTTNTNSSFTTVGEDLGDYTNVPFGSPYITINPVNTLGGVDITSDGFNFTISALTDFLDSCSSGYYNRIASSYYSGSSGNTNIQNVRNLISSNKIIMFKSEETEYTGTDFPVLLIDNADPNTITTALNSLIRVLTANNEDYGTSLNYYYDVAIYKMTYSAGSFTPSLTAPSLKHSGGNFFTSETLFDSGKEQFTLVDVRFLAPTNATQVAYHLYIPVYVKKVLTFNFEIAVESGTKYIEDEYTSKYGVALIENIGSPITLYFKYTYNRTISDWLSAVNGGENIYRSYAKTLEFTKPSASNILANLPADTVLVLVDRNRGGKPYYSTIGEAMVNGELSLSAFTETMGKDNEGYTFSGESFTPLKLSEFLSLTATPDNAGHLLQCAVNDPNVVVVIGNNGYRYETDSEEVGQRYVISGSITSGASEIEESYYISIFTESNQVNDALFHYFLISSPSRFTDGGYPLKMVSDVNHPELNQLVHLIMGKIFYHSGITLHSDSIAGSDLMTNINNTLEIDVSAEFGLSDDLSNDIKADIRNFIAVTDVYQSFIIYLNRKDGNDITKAILGNPTGSGNYTIDYTLDGERSTSPTNYDALNIRITQNHAEFVSPSLSSNFATGNKFEIIAQVSLTYSPSAITAQFPGRSALLPDNGTTVSASSNISFNENLTAYSKNFIIIDETPVVSYYSESDPEVATLDLNPLGDMLGDFTALGINASNNNNSDESTFDLLAVLDTTPIREIIDTGDNTYAEALIKIELLQKQNDGTYGSALDISKYMTVSFDGILTPVTDNDTFYSIVIDTSNLDDNGDEITIPVITCVVKTGSGSNFEASGDNPYYSNYKVVVTVSLRNSAHNEISASIASGFVVYTNARIQPKFLD